MRKFIRNRKTGLFLARSGRWTADVGKAIEFCNDPLLQKVYAEYRLPSCELYYCFCQKPSHLDFAFPLSRLPWLKASKAQAGRKRGLAQRSQYMLIAS